VTPEDISRLSQQVESIFGSTGSVARAVEQVNRVAADVQRFVEGADRVAEQLNRAAQRVNCFVEECSRVTAVAERAVAGQAHLHERILRSAEVGAEALMKNSQRLDEQVVQVFGKTAAQVIRFEHATSRLEAGQRARVGKVLEDWEPISSVELRPPSRPQTLFERFGDWLLGRQRRARGLEDYLGTAHRHPAVARKERGRRRWFEDWRREALFALQLGFDPRELLARAAAIPVRPRRRHELRPDHCREVRGHDFLCRLEHVIAPNAPSGAHLYRCSVTEMGPGC
jgi:hypothetical protein